MPKKRAYPRRRKSKITSRPLEFSVRLKPKAKKKLFLWGLFLFIGLALFFNPQREIPKLFQKAQKTSLKTEKAKAPQKPAQKKTTQASHPSPAAAVSQYTMTVPPPVPLRTPPPVRPSRYLDPQKPKMAIVLDDMGHTLENLNLLVSLGDQITYAILPHLTHSEDFGYLSDQTGAEVILHQPLEAKNGTIPGPGLITNRMDDTQIRQILESNLQTVPRHVGSNNHMGSLGTTDPELLTAIFENFRQRDLFFLDSMTTPESIGYKVAAQMGVPALRRDIFLDNVDSLPAVRREVYKLASLAKRRGYAIGIGHYRYNTLAVLNEAIPELKAQGFQFVSLSDIFRLRKREI